MKSMQSDLLKLETSNGKTISTPIIMPFC